jgi:hypothetical protein
LASAVPEAIREFSIRKSRPFLREIDARRYKRCLQIRERHMAGSCVVKQLENGPWVDGPPRFEERLVVAQGVLDIGIAQVDGAGGGRGFLVAAERTVVEVSKSLPSRYVTALVVRTSWRTPRRAL